MNREELLGSWRLERAETVDDDRIVDATPFGERPLGILHYLVDGRVAVLIAHDGRQPMAGGRSHASDRARLEAARTFVAYGGWFEVMADRVIHHVDINSHPNDVGVDYVRLARFVGDLLELATPTDIPPDQRAMRLLWRRLEPVESAPQF